MSSATRAWLLLLSLFVALLFAGHHWAGREGLLWAVVVSLSINSLIYFYSDQKLRGRFRGRLIEGQDPWGLTEMVQRLAQKSRIPLPQVVVLEDDSPQAFSFGRNWRNGTLVLTDGLLSSLSREELEAVIAYLVVCIQRMDTLLFSVAGAFCGAFLFCTQTLDTLLRWLIGAKRGGIQSQLFTYALAPVTGFVLKICATPSNYYSIDAQAAKYLNNPKVLAEVLWKLQSYSSTVPFRAPPSLGHFFMVNPLTSHSWTRYFRVQPSVERRIKKLVGYFPI